MQRIIVKNITKRFGLDKPKGISGTLSNISSRRAQKNYLTALDDISFSVAKGEVLGIIGSNGSGKTTLLRTIAGLYRPDSGTVTVNGSLAPLLHIGTGFHADLDAVDNIIMYGMLLGMTKAQITQKVHDIIKYAELEKFSKQKLRYFSSGMRARLAFSTAMQVEADILLVDELLSVGDRKFKEKSYKAFLSLKEKGKTIVHVTHNLEKVSKFSDRVLLIHQGKMVMIGNPEDAVRKYIELVQPVGKISS